MFQKVYDSQEWQDYMKSESLEPLPMDAAQQKVYWETQVQRHKELFAEMKSE
jgi:tripartite-type tricarboxylate transporter receptor subunit TctC